MLHRALDRLDQEFSDRAVILTAEGPTFLAGIDLPYVAGLLSRRDSEALRAWQLRYFETNLRLFAIERPLIAAVNGHAFAGGLIAALCAAIGLQPKAMPASPSMRFRSASRCLPPILS
jgi:enoyl-CoA hydratase